MEGPTAGDLDLAGQRARIEADCPLRAFERVARVAGNAVLGAQSLASRNGAAALLPRAA
jgi:hypothetical protein